MNPRGYPRVVVAVLLPAFLWACCSVRPVRGQDVSGGNGGAAPFSPVQMTTDDDGNDYSEEILIGFFAVVVAVLVVLGLRADRDWATDPSGRRAYASSTTERSVQLDASGLGWRARF